jgi:hypothetical protein
VRAIRSPLLFFWHSSSGTYFSVLFIFAYYGEKQRTKRKTKAANESHALQKEQQSKSFNDTLSDSAINATAGTLPFDPVQITYD